MAHDDDLLTGPVPDVDAEPTAAELAHARRFAELVDKTLTGRTPPAMSADDRALLEVATVIRATRGQLALSDERRGAIVEDALRQAIGAGATGATGAMAAAGRAAGAASATAAAGAVGGASGDASGDAIDGGGVASIAGARRRRARGWAPWAVSAASALVAAAAVALLWLRPPPPRQAPVAARPAVPVEWLSRPADALIGPIARDHAGDASARIDAIFADRLDGFRARRLSQRATRGTP